jgi:hypothetical protein
MTFVKERSAKRPELKECTQRKEKADQATEAKLRSYDQTKDQVARTQESVRSRQATVQVHNANEAASIGPDGLPPPLSAKQRETRRVAEDDLAVAVRALRVVEANSEVARKEYEAAALAAGKLEREIDAAVLAVVVEEAELAIERWCEARKAAIETEKAVRSFIQVLTQRQCFAEVERLSNRFRDLGRQREYETDPTPYEALFDRLRSDPDAVVTP